MDGNSRWATQQGLPTLVGHQRGVDALRRTVAAARRWGIRALTVYAFSQENWQRDVGEVSFLMDLFSATLPQQLPELQANGVRLQFIGERGRLPQALQQQVAACEAVTAGNSDLTLTVAVSYSGQQDVADAAAALVAAACRGELKPEDVTPALVARHLSTAALTAQHGPPDLTIRTSGEQRLSNWMLFESAFTELCFLNVLFPDFGEEHFAAALQQYAGRQRRYGRRV